MRTRLELTRHRRVLGWQFLQKRFKRKIDGLGGVEHGGKMPNRSRLSTDFQGLAGYVGAYGVNTPSRLGDR